MLVPGFAVAQRQPEPSGMPYHFRQDWCPTLSEAQELEAAFIVTYNDCCIRTATQIVGSLELAKQVLSRYAERVTMSAPSSACTGGGPEAQLRRDNAQQAALKRERLELPLALREMSSREFCATVGRFFRQEEWIESAPTLRYTAMPIIQNELRRRNLRLSDKRVLNKTFNIGDSECHLYAALGYPEKVNSTVSSSGTRAQHIYGRSLYVYTENSVVTSFQY